MFWQHRQNKCEKKDRNKALIAQYSRGNVSLQNQRFVTEQEKNERRKRVLSFKFAWSKSVRFEKGWLKHRPFLSPKQKKKLLTEHGIKSQLTHDSQIHTRQTPPIIVEQNSNAFWSLVTEFRQAENLLKSAEWDDLRLDIPTINELRYAGFHLINALETSDLHKQLNEFNKGIQHCRRASYDAIELGLINELEQIIEFQGDYRLLPVTDALPDFVELMEQVEEIKEKLGQNEKAPNRDAYYEEAEAHLNELRKINRKLKVARTELNKHLARDKKIAKRWLAGFIIAALGLIYGIGSDWFDTSYNEQKDQQQKAEEQKANAQPSAIDKNQDGDLQNKSGSE